MEYRHAVFLLLAILTLGIYIISKKNKE